MDLSISVWHAYVVLFFLNKIINDFFSLTVCVYKMCSMQPMDVYACGCNAKPLVDDNPNGFHRFQAGFVDVDDRSIVAETTMCGYKMALTSID